MFLGNIVRMWQPFNGLQVYPAGVGKTTVHLLIMLQNLLSHALRRVNDTTHTLSSRLIFQKI